MVSRQFSKSMEYYVGPHGEQFKRVTISSGVTHVQWVGVISVHLVCNLCWKDWSLQLDLSNPFNQIYLNAFDGTNMKFSALANREEVTWLYWIDTLRGSRWLSGFFPSAVHHWARVWSPVPALYVYLVSSAYKFASAGFSLDSLVFLLHLKLGVLNKSVSGIIWSYTIVLALIGSWYGTASWLLSPLGDMSCISKPKFIYLLSCNETVLQLLYLVSPQICYVKWKQPFFYMCVITRAKVMWRQTCHANIEYMSCFYLTALPNFKWNFNCTATST